MDAGSIPARDAKFGPSQLDREHQRTLSSPGGLIQIVKGELKRAHTVTAKKTCSTECRMKAALSRRCKMETQSAFNDCYIS